MKNRLNSYMLLIFMLLVLSCDNKQQTTTGGWYYFNFNSNTAPIYFELHMNDNFVKSYSFFDMFKKHESLYSINGDSIQAYEQKSYFKVDQDTLHTEYFGETVRMTPIKNWSNTTPAIRFITLMGEGIDNTDSVSVQNFSRSMREILWISHFPNYPPITPELSPTAPSY